MAMVHNKTVHEDRFCNLQELKVTFYKKLKYIFFKGKGAKMNLFKTGVSIYMEWPKV